jgi:hypothetical protein
VTVIGYEPASVVNDALTVSVLVKVGFPDKGLKRHKPPKGRPLVQDKLTGWVVVMAPLVNGELVTVIVFELELP